MKSVENTPTRKRPSGLLYVVIVLIGRIIGMVLITLTIPTMNSFTHVLDQLDGPTQFGMMIGAYADGAMAALVYLVVGTAAHFAVWKRSIRTKGLVEGIVLCLFVFWLVCSNL